MDFLNCEILVTVPRYRLPFTVPRSPFPVHRSPFTVYFSSYLQSNIIYHFPSKICTVFRSPLVRPWLGIHLEMFFNINMNLKLAETEICQNFKSRSSVIPGNGFSQSSNFNITFIGGISECNDYCNDFCLVFY